MGWFGRLLSNADNVNLIWKTYWESTFGNGNKDNTYNKYLSSNSRSLLLEMLSISYQTLENADSFQPAIQNISKDILDLLQQNLANMSLQAYYLKIARNLVEKKTIQTSDSELVVLKERVNKEFSSTLQGQGGKRDFIDTTLIGRLLKVSENWFKMNNIILTDIFSPKFVQEYNNILGMIILYSFIVFETEQEYFNFQNSK